MITIRYLPYMALTYGYTEGNNRAWFPIRGIKVDIKAKLAIATIQSDFANSVVVPIVPIVAPPEETASMKYDGTKLILKGMTLICDLEGKQHDTIKSATIQATQEGYTYNEEPYHGDWTLKADGYPYTGVTLIRKAPTKSNTKVSFPEEKDVVVKMPTKSNVPLYPYKLKGQHPVSNVLGCSVYSLHLDYKEGCGPICTVSFLPEWVVIKTKKLTTLEVERIPETENNPMVKFYSLGCEQPDEMLDLDCEWKPIAPKGEAG